MRKGDKHVRGNAHHTRHRKIVGTALVIWAAMVITVMPPPSAGKRGGGSGDNLSGAYTHPQEGEVTLTLNSTGFTPSELTRLAGVFSLSVDNRTEAAELTFHLFREDGSLVRELPVPRGTVDWSESLNLPVGQYTLKEIAHPDWTCQITIQ